jgi:hypothetical protein
MEVEFRTGPCQGGKEVAIAVMICREDVLGLTLVCVENQRDAQRPHGDSVHGDRAHILRLSQTETIDQKDGDVA